MNRFFGAGCDLSLIHIFDKDSGDIRTKKMGYFHGDRENFQDVQESTGTLGKRHPLAFILEAADDIAYKTADIEDRCV